MLENKAKSAVEGHAILRIRSGAAKPSAVLHCEPGERSNLPPKLQIASPDFRRCF
jgi:hypothetical protein